MGNNKLFFGENGILSAKLGTSDVKIYLGKDLIYEPSTIIVAKFVKNKGDGATVISGSKPTTYFEEIVIDGVEQKIVSAYTFDTLGEHTIEYTLLTPHVISDDSFGKCAKMTSITIPNDVTSIGVRAFYSCSGLATIVIPNSVTSIGDNAFQYCSGLTSVTVNAVTPPTLGKNAFANNAKGRLIYVPSSSFKEYQQDWSEYASDIVAIK